MRYLKIRNGKFYFANKVVGTQIDANVRVAGKRFLRWVDNNLVDERTCFNEYDLPSGWTLAYDLDLLLDGVPHRLTLQGRTVQYAFKPYLAGIVSKHLALEHVVTRITIDDSGKGYPSLKFQEVLEKPRF
nr:hypothetical protein [uncultured Pseudodesulfovibrio sp.]